MTMMFWRNGAAPADHAMIDDAAAQPGSETGPQRAWRIASSMPVPAMSQMTLAQSGALRDVIEYDQGDVHVSIAEAPLRQGSVDPLRECLVRALAEAGFRRIDVEVIPARR